MKIISHRTISSFALAAAVVTLAACKSEPESFNTGTGDPDAAELANAAPPPMLPMIKSSHTYRCKDNSLITVDMMTDDKSANFRLGKDSPITPLTAPEAGQPYVSADGKITVTGAGSAITYNGMACKTG